MHIRDLIAAIESVAPRHLAESWDTTGLLVGDAGAEFGGGVLLTIDLNDAVLAEAEALFAGKPGVIIAYHPPIFEGLKSVTSATRAGRLVLRAASRGIAIYSPHTALDAATGGMTDWLADGIAAGSREVERRAIVPWGPKDSAGSVSVKLITFAPAGEVEQIREAMAAAGAGVIGAYSRCSFASPGTGTFMGGDSTAPAVGRKGVLESVAEMRMEMVCPRGSVAAAVAALRGAHSYEEPAIDIVPLLPVPAAGGLSIGSGRVVRLVEPVPVSELAARLAKLLGCPVQTTADRDRPVRVIGLCPGAGASLLGPARALGCEAFVTGELKHHECLGAIDSGLSLLLAGHTQTERGYLPLLADRLTRVLSGVRCAVSRVDAPPVV